jgi:hypothetical protein
MRPGEIAVWAVVVLLAILHQDVWFWGDQTLVLGFMPVGLFYHAMFSLACGGVWALAVMFAWPGHLEVWAEKSDQEPLDRGRR